MTSAKVYSKLSLEYSLSGMLFYDLKKMTVLFSNSQATFYLSQNSETSIVGQKVYDFISLSVPDRSILKSDGFYGELTFIRHDGAVFPALTLIKAGSEEHPDLGVLSFQDISAQKKILRDLTAKHEGLTEILEELHGKNEELLKLDKAKDKFLSLVTHELRTPLNTIVATSEIIYNKMYENEEEHHELAKNLYLQSHHMLDLVNDILDMTKIHSGKMEFYIERDDPTEIIREQGNFFSDLATESQVEIVFEEPLSPPLCYFDSMRLKQIVANLISNAIKFNRPGGKVFLRMAVVDSFVEISVADQGIGIPEGKFESIFNEFETIESISNHHKGTGLGLSIVRSLVRGLGGQIQVESTVGRGATFFVRLPVEKILDPGFYRARDNAGVFFFDDSSSE